MDLTREVAQAKARLHRPIAQRARWARHDFLREINALRDQARLLYGVEKVRAFGEARGLTLPVDWNGAVLRPLDGDWTPRPGKVWAVEDGGPQDVVVDAAKAGVSPKVNQPIV